MDQFLDNLARQLATASSRRDALRIGFSVLLGAVASGCAGANPFSGCSGTQVPCNGHCNPAGSVCCSDGSYCSAGSSCCNNNTQCCPNCGNSGAPCPSGTTCCNGHCNPAGSVCCGDGSYCSAGTTCCNNNTQCCSNGGGGGACGCPSGQTYNFQFAWCCPNNIPIYYPGTHGIVAPGCYATCPYVGDCSAATERC